MSLASSHSNTHTEKKISQGSNHSARGVCSSIIASSSQPYAVMSWKDLSFSVPSSSSFFCLLFCAVSSCDDIPKWDGITITIIVNAKYVNVNCSCFVFVHLFLKKNSKFAVTKAQNKRKAITKHRANKEMLEKKKEIVLYWRETIDLPAAP